MGCGVWNGGVDNRVPEFDYGRAPSDLPLASWGVTIGGALSSNKKNLLVQNWSFFCWICHNFSLSGNFQNLRNGHFWRFSGPFSWPYQSWPVLSKLRLFGTRAQKPRDFLNKGQFWGEYILNLELFCDHPCIFSLLHFHTPCLSCSQLKAFSYLLLSTDFWRR